MANTLECAAEPSSHHGGTSGKVCVRKGSKWQEQQKRTSKARAVGGAPWRNY